MKSFKKVLLILLAGLFLISVIVFAVPSLRERALTRLGLLRTRIDYFFNPPEEALFVPATPDGSQLPTPVAQITTAPITTALPGAEETQAALEPTLIPPPTPTLLPEKVEIPNVPYQDQHGFWNFCAPANLDMALRFWGWQGKPQDIGEFVKPFEKDKNVMPYELANFVQEKTSYHSVIRYGGTLSLLKTYAAQGIPVVVEKGVYTRDISGKISWMGHYNIVIGYDDAAQKIKVHDSLLAADHYIPYDAFLDEWRGFNYVFMIVYPIEKENDVYNSLGDYTDETQSYRIAADIASNEIAKLSGKELFHAWFNRGSSLRLLQDYAGAAQAYDEAFKLLVEIPKNDRPWRIVWYETGPYYAYYYTGRYQDVLGLADTTINAATEPYIEESFYWRAMAKNMLGDTAGAHADFCQSLEYHPAFGPTTYQMQVLGYGACP